MPAHPEDPVMRGVTSIAKTLNVVVRDERSGEVVRTIEYTHIPREVHRSDKLNGLLLNQFVGALALHPKRN